MSSTVYSAGQGDVDTTGVWGQEIDSMKLQWKVLLIDVLGTDAGCWGQAPPSRPRSRAQAWKLSYMGPDSNVPQQKWKLVLNTSRYCYVDTLWALRFSKENRLWWIRSLSRVCSHLGPAHTDLVPAQLACHNNIVYRNSKIFTAPKNILTHLWQLCTSSRRPSRTRARPAPPRAPCT